jgi:hypothetical protein
MVGNYNRSACCVGQIGCRFRIMMNLKNETRRSLSKSGLDFISISGRRRSIFIDFLFHRTRLPEKWHISPG